MDDERKAQFYMQVATALIRRLGGTVVIPDDEFEKPAAAVKHRKHPGSDGVEIMIVEADNPS